MPNERRELLFDSDELMAALIDQLLRSGKNPRSGKIIGCLLVAEPRTTVHLKAEGTKLGEDLISPLSPEFVVAALLRFCKHFHIPIPRRATKTLRIVDDKLCLEIVLPRDTGRLEYLMRPT